MNVKGGGSAFPRAGHHENGNGKLDGMSLRDYFANGAMQGLLADHVSRIQHQAEPLPPQIVAQASYAYADAMLAERAK